MSITKSYNKQNDTYYAYETEYVYVNFLHN